MIEFCKENLLELRKLLHHLNHDQYVFKSDILSGASIGQHIRHILEYYICLLDGSESGIVNYDLRKRDKNVENKTGFAIQTIEKIIERLTSRSDDFHLVLSGNYSRDGLQSEVIDSSFFRELSYNLEHSIHHQALIKIGLKELGISHLIDDNFGVAPATIRYQQSFER